MLLSAIQRFLLPLPVLGTVCLIMSVFRGCLKTFLFRRSFPWLITATFVVPAQWLSSFLDTLLVLFTYLLIIDYCDLPYNKPTKQIHARKLPHDNVAFEVSIFNLLCYEAVCLQISTQAQLWNTCPFLFSPLSSSKQLVIIWGPIYKKS